MSSRTLSPLARRSSIAKGSRIAPSVSQNCRGVSCRKLRTNRAGEHKKCVLHRWTQSAISEQAEAHTGSRDGSKELGAEFDVSSNVISPSFRSTPWEAERRKEANSADVVQLLFVSESNVCRSVLAEATMNDLLKAYGMSGTVKCASRGSKDFNIGDPPDKALLAVAAELDLRLPEGQVARQFDHETDIVSFDLVLVMDKYCAADVLREVSVYDTINKAGKYSAKVRMLGEYHKQLSGSKQPDGQDIDDPLYGNIGGQEEQEAVQRTAMIIAEACNGLLEFLQQTKLSASANGLTFRQELISAIDDLEAIDWLVPPMLSGP